MLFLCAVRLFSSVRIAAIRGQTDRNIRKVRATMLRKIRKEMYAALLKKEDKKKDSLTLLEKQFMKDYVKELEKKQ